MIAKLFVAGVLFIGLWMLMSGLAPKRPAGRWEAAPSRRFLNYEVRWNAGPESRFVEGPVPWAASYFGSKAAAERRAALMNERKIPETFDTNAMPVDERNRISAELRASGTDLNYMD